MTSRRLLLGGILLTVAGFCIAQGSGSNPTLRTPMAGDQVVWGTASPGSGPIAIYDVSVKAQIGTAKAVATDGTFSSSVNPPLVKGHQITAVDQNGKTSAPVTVAETGPRPAPAPRAQ